jgi:hypothetical protein
MGIGSEILQRFSSSEPKAGDAECRENGASKLYLG